MRTIYGRHPVEALLEARPEEIHRLFVGDPSDPLVQKARARGVRVEVSQRASLAQLAKSEHHQGVVAQAKEFSYVDLEDLCEAPGPALILALDSVQDPQNLGALVRSAEVFGATGVVIPQDRAALVTPAAAKASAGAVERLPLAKVVNLARALDKLKAAHLWVTGLAGEASESIEDVDFTGPSVLVVGAEGAGLRPLIRKTCDRVVSLPMAGKTGSLNASVAGAVALWVAASQRRRQG